MHYCCWIFIPDRLAKRFVDDCIWQDDELGPVVTVCGKTLLSLFDTYWWIVIGYQDHLRAKKRYLEAMDAEEHAARMRHREIRREIHRERLIEWMERTPVNRAWNYVTSGISRAVSHCSELNPIPKLSQITYLLTYWRRRRIGEYGCLEAIDIMKEEKEYWEAFHKGR